MTKEQLCAEMAYHASLHPFNCLLRDGVISDEDYATIKTMLHNKYHPIFGGYMPQIQVDNTPVQS